MNFRREIISLWQPWRNMELSNICQHNKPNWKQNVIASNQIRICNVKWIVADIHFLAAISELWFNKEFSGIKGKTPILDLMGIYPFTGPFEHMFNYMIWIECKIHGKELTCLWLIDALILLFQLIQRKRKTCNGTIFFS